MPKDKQIIEPINATFDEVSGALVPPLNRKKNNMLNKEIGVLVPPPNAMTEGSALFETVTDKEINGIGMGVLTDGTPYLTLKGISKLCGVDKKAISTLSKNWDDEKTKPRGKTIASILEDNQYTKDVLFIKVHTLKDEYINAYPDIVCMALLEYYAFESRNETAIQNYRVLARKTLREFIYTQVGYDPNNSVPEIWKQFHDRVSLTYNSLPNGFFGIFKEISDIIVTLGQAGLHINSSFVPDGSVGLCWAKYWNDNDLDKKYGNRQKWRHNYPDYFPQAKSNPQDAWCYPDDALGEFRRWVREIYMGKGKFENYINKKVKDKQLPPSFAQLAISAYREKE